MPYIEQERRQYVDRWLADVLMLAASRPSVGDLNYMVTNILVTWLGHDFDYERLNGAIGVLEAAKLELYRRLAVPYEDYKRDTNGEVYV